jgi:hypothetical protein
MSREGNIKTRRKRQAPLEKQRKFTEYFSGVILTMKLMNIHVCRNQMMGKSMSSESKKTNGKFQNILSLPHSQPKQISRMEKNLISREASEILFLESATKRYV